MGNNSAQIKLISSLNPAHTKLNETIAPYTTFRIGGPADIFYTATSSQDLAGAVNAARELEVPYFVLGLGANILVGDKGFRGIVIHNKADRVEFLPDNRVLAESGTIIGQLIPMAITHSLSGLEHYVGIPSTVGGAVWQNLHFLSPAPERERTMFIEEVVESCELLYKDGTVRTVSNSEMSFGYDTSILHSGDYVALSVMFKLENGEPAKMHKITQENLSWRGSRHPWLEIHPSAGSIFKKIEGVGAGRLIDQLGLKGHIVGGAQISHNHANIVINLGNATAADVRNLISGVQQAVKDKFGYRLEPEIGFIGEF